MRDMKHIKLKLQRNRKKKILLGRSLRVEEGPENMMNFEKINFNKKY